MLALSLCLRYVDRADLYRVMAVCRKLNDLARDELRHRTYALANIAFRCIKNNPGVLAMAGSMPLWLNMGGPRTWFPNDVDLFWYGGKYQVYKDDECVLMFQDGKNWFSVSFIYGLRPLVRNYTNHNGNVQFILSSHFPTLRSILETFDLTCCRIGCTERGKYTVLEGFSPAWFHKLRVPEREMWTLGHGTATDLVMLSTYHYNRTLERARKYAARGLEDRGDIEGTVEVLTFSIMYRRSHCNVYENRLEEPSKTELRNECVCGLEECSFETPFEFPLVYAHDPSKINHKEM